MSCMMWVQAKKQFLVLYRRYVLPTLFLCGSALMCLCVTFTLFPFFIIFLSQYGDSNFVIKTFFLPLNSYMK